MRILLADDAALLREGLAGLLTTAGHEVVAQVADADALRTEVGRLAAAGELPDVVVTDVRMPPTGTDDGLRAAIDLRRTYPGLPVVVLSAYVAGPYVQDLLEETESPTSPAGPGAPSVSSGGAVGYLLKERVGRVARAAFMRWETTSGSMTTPPPTTMSSECRKSATRPTRSLSR